MQWLLAVLAVQYSTHDADYRTSLGGLWQMGVFLAGVVLMTLGVRRMVRLRAVPWSLILGVAVVGLFFAVTEL